MELRLNANESALLSEIIEGALGDLCTEIHDTDDSRFTAQLREREQQLQSLLDLMRTGA